MFTKCNNLCPTHSEGKYQKWRCNNQYSPKERSERFQKSKIPCKKCGKISSKGLCKKCNGKIQSERMKGRKLPKKWCLNISLGQREEKAHNWKETGYGYSTLHKWLYKKDITKDECLYCKIKKNLQYANKSGLYLRKISDWIVLCAKCHSKHDSQIKNKVFEWNGKDMIRKEK